jgi:hypothetical protein
MKSKNYILMQIKDLYTNKLGLYDHQADGEIEKIKDKTVYELLVIKKTLSESEDGPNMQCLHWFRDESRFDN